MNFEKFKTIIDYNAANQGRFEEKVRRLYFQMNMNYEKDLLNLIMIVRPLLYSEGYIIIELPFKDKEIGAICYKGDTLGYIILNSSLPKVNVNFALSHEIYHAFYRKDKASKGVELYINEHYYEHEEEMSANLFAGIFLMPTPSFKEMFSKFSNEQGAEDAGITIIVKLMSYFEVPYMAVLIRAYELGLLKDGELLRELLEADSCRIEEEFSRLWLDEGILCPTGRDDFNRLEQLVKKEGARCESKEILDGAAVEKILENMRSIYREIRG